MFRKEIESLRNELHYTPLEELTPKQRVIVHVVTLISLIGSLALAYALGEGDFYSHILTPLIVGVACSLLHTYLKHYKERKDALLATIFISGCILGTIGASLSQTPIETTVGAGIALLAGANAVYLFSTTYREAKERFERALKTLVATKKIPSQQLLKELIETLGAYPELIEEPIDTPSGKVSPLQYALNAFNPVAALYLKGLGAATAADDTALKEHGIDGWLEYLNRYVEPADLRQRVQYALELYPDFKRYLLPKALPGSNLYNILSEV